MVHTYIVHQDEFELNIYRDGRRFWGMRIPNLAGTISDGQGGRISEWITHLSEKTWAKLELLYQYAQRIQELHPKNDIDWYITFMMVERGEYVDQAHEATKALRPDGEQIGLSDLFGRMEAGSDSHNPEESQQLHEIVVRKLREHNLPFAER